MEARNSTILESSPEDTMLFETVKSLIKRDRKETENEDDFFLVSQVQETQYSDTNVKEETSHKHQMEETYQWMNLCRICANANDHLIPIFEGEGAELDLSNKILKYLPIHISRSDTLPLQLCYHCAVTILAWHELSKDCLNAEKKLLEMQHLLQDKQQVHNDVPLINLDVSTPVTSSISTISNITISQTDQANCKNNTQDTEEINKFNRNWKMPNSIEVDMRHISGFFTNLSFIHEVNNHTSCVHATVRGSREPDRYIILSANGDGIIITLEMVQVLDRIYSVHDWRPRRSLIFCVSLLPLDVCPQTLPDFLRRKVVAYVAVHDYSLQAYGYVTLSGSDIMQSIAIEAIKTIPGNSNWTHLERKASDSRLFLDIPQVLFSFNESNLTRNEIYHDQNSRLHAVTLAQMISQTIWRLSESIIIKWEPKYFNETINRILESIDTSKFQEVIEKLKRTLRILLAAIKDLNIKIDTTENTQALCMRIWNDLLLDLDRALLCPDERFYSKTDLATLRKLSLKSTNSTLNYLNDMIKCYENAIQILQE
ncbi:uncharacterized protein LOC116846767 isoform X2 [Odontomachus brunneus]|uniref:uncharacterized protein LOC116846767 isoform X2 n=1 Tax=Odontomachus brunneus TaxID=486640 RepID=UPI0013F1DAE4|nr:uncharacterized protein LOC116846767 isoform X2 [Odontomachus brunneus]